MKKLIVTTLTLTMLVTPLVGSVCFANKVNKPKTSYVRNEKCSEEFKLRKDECPKLKKFLAGVAAGAIALTYVTVAALKKFEDKLPENLKSKLQFLFTKETQGDNESEKVLEAFKEGEDVETFIEKLNIAKDEAVGPAGIENRNGFTHDEIIEPLTINNSTPTIVDNITNNTIDTNNIADANNTNWVSGLKNTVASSAKELAIGTGILLGSVFLMIFCLRARKNFERVVANVNLLEAAIKSNNVDVAAQIKGINRELLINTMSTYNLDLREAIDCLDEDRWGSDIINILS